MNSIIFSPFDEFAANKLYTQQFADNPVALLKYIRKNIFLVCLILFLAILMNTTLPFMGIFTGLRPREIKEEAYEINHNFQALVDILTTPEASTNLNTPEQPSSTEPSLVNTLLRETTLKSTKNIILEKIAKLDKLDNTQRAFIRIAQDIIRYCFMPKELLLRELVPNIVQDEELKRERMAHASTNKYTNKKPEDTIGLKTKIIPENNLNFNVHQAEKQQNKTTIYLQEKNNNKIKEQFRHNQTSELIFRQGQEKNPNYKEQEHVTTYEAEKARSCPEFRQSNPESLQSKNECYNVYYTVHSKNCSRFIRG
jgi:hypothetical protein